MSVIPDSEFGDRVCAKLREQVVVWLTTTSADGTPQPNPVWFLWDGESDWVLVYSANDAKRLEHVAVRPWVSLNFDGDGQGGDIVVLLGVAEQAPDEPSADQNEPYLAKYRERIGGIGMTEESFAQAYSVPLRVRFGKVRGH
jgi:PPOX class probable F420-dependent enzyme